jgi:hypothetical protein
VIAVTPPVSPSAASDCPLGGRLGGQSRGDRIFAVMRVSLALVVLLMTASPALGADSAIDEAKAHVRTATASYNLGNYMDAAKEYEAAYMQTLDANLLFNIAQCYRLAGERDRAITAYRSFIRSAPRSEQRGLAESKLRDLEQQRSVVPASQPKPAAPDAPPPVTAAPAPVAPPAPPPSPIQPSAPTSPLPAQPAGALLAQQPPPEPAQKESHFYTRWPFWTAVGVAVAGGIVLAVILSQGKSNPDMGNPSLGSKEF